MSQYNQYNRKNPKSFNESYNNHNNQQKNQYSKKYEDSQDGKYQDDYKGNSYQNNNSDYHYKPKGFSSRKGYGHHESDNVYVEKDTTYVDKGRGAQVSYKPKPKNQHSHKEYSEIKEKIPVESSNPHSESHPGATEVTHIEYVPKNPGQDSQQQQHSHPHHNAEDKKQRKDRPPRKDKKQPADSNKEGGEPKSQQSIESGHSGPSSKNDLDHHGGNKPPRNQRERPPRGEKKKGNPHKEFVPRNEGEHGHPVAAVGEHSNQQEGGVSNQHEKPNRQFDRNKGGDGGAGRPPKDRNRDHQRGGHQRGDHQRGNNRDPKPHNFRNKNWSEKESHPEQQNTSSQQAVHPEEEVVKTVVVERELPPFDPDDEEAVQEMLRLTALLFESAVNIPGSDDIPNVKDITKKGAKLEVLPSGSTQPEKVEKRGKKGKEEKKQDGENKEEKKKPKKNPLHWICSDFNKVYHYKRNFLELYNQLEETWEEIHATFEDDWETYKCLERTKPYYFHAFTIFVVIYFHLLIEKELFEQATEFYELQKEVISKEGTFGPIIKDAIYEIQKLNKGKGPQGGSGFARGHMRVKKRLPDRLELSDFGRKFDDVVIVEKFEKFNNKHLRIEVLEKIKKEDKIAIYYEENPHIENFLSIIQVATKNEVFILDLQRICHFDDNVKLLVEFLTLTLGKKSSTIIVNDANQLCEKLIKTMFIEKEQKDPEFVKLKTDLCSTLDKYKNNFTDMSKLGLGKNIREIAQNVLEVKIDERERFGNWYRRPLSNDQITMGAIDVLTLFSCYSKLFDDESED